MPNTTHLQILIEQQIQDTAYPVRPAGLYEPLQYFMTIGGKRIRPALLMLAAEMFNGTAQQVMPAALAIEHFHNFTLIHDDIMDKAPLRRAQQTVHEKWDTNTAILSGDVLMIKAYQYLQTIEDKYFKTVFKLFNRTATEVCEGQQFDMNFEQIETVSIPEYIEMIRLKTAVLLGAALQIGAILAGADAQNTQLMYDFGVNLGIAFQLQDDLLDVFSENENEFGKQKAGDILSNKKTFLILKALELADEKDKNTLENLYHNVLEIAAEEKINTVTQLFEQLDIPKITEIEIQKYAQKAIQCLENTSVNADKKAPLLYFVQQLNQRKK